MILYIYNPDKDPTALPYSRTVTLKVNIDLPSVATIINKNLKFLQKQWLNSLIKNK